MAWEKKYCVDLERLAKTHRVFCECNDVDDMNTQNTLSLGVIAAALIGIGERIEEVARLLEQKSDSSTAPTLTGSRICTRCSMTWPLSYFDGESCVCYQCA